MFRKVLQIAVVALGAAAGGFAMSYFDGPETPDRAEIERILMQPPIGDIYTTVKQYYPEDAEEWLDRTEETLRNPAARRANPNAGFEIGATLRRRRAPALAAAPDHELRNVIDFNISTFDWAMDDPDLCGKLIVEGPMVLPTAERQAFLDRLDGTVLWRAIHAGDTNPVPRGPSTERDWEAFLAAYLDKGGTESDLQRVVNPSPSDPALCEATAVFLKTVRDANFPGAARIRAEVAVAIAES